MKITRSILPFCLISATFTGCAAQQAAQPVTRTPVSLTLETDSDLETWQTAAARISSAIPEYDIQMVQTGRDQRSFNHIETGPEGMRVCFEPQMRYDFAGNITGYAPLYCSTLDAASPAESLTQAVDGYQAQLLSPKTDLPEAEYRAWVLAQSSPASPLCYSVFPMIFISAGQQPLPLIENYLLACANAIDGHAPWPQLDPSTLANRLRALAAMLSHQNTFIAASFRAIAADNTLEGNIYGASLEGYTEMMSQKKRQSEITTIEALHSSDTARLYYLSEQNAIRLFYLAMRAEDMNTERLGAIIQALEPPEKWPNAVADTRSMMQLRTCRALTTLPEMTPSLVTTCLPWMRTMTRNADDFETALRILEQGMYGAKDGEPPITDEVLSWLRYAPLNNENVQLRHVFGQRNAHHDNLTPQQRDILLGF